MTQIQEKQEPALPLVPSGYQRQFICFQNLSLLSKNALARFMQGVESGVRFNVAA